MKNYLTYRKEIPFEMLNQRQLMTVRFMHHKLAVFGLVFLVALYFVAIFAEFFSPYSSNRQNLNYTYCPPHRIGISWEKGGFLGMYAKGIEQKVDPVTLRKYYVRDKDNDAPLGFFVKGEEYKLWGIFSSNLHFLGVDYNRLKMKDVDFTQPIDKVFFLNGTDRYGRDITSRLIRGARVSLSVGLIGVMVSFVLGVIIGGISGYNSGRVDMVIQRIIEIINSFPHLPLYLAIGAAVPQNWSALLTYFCITIILSLLSWTRIARVVRGKILSLREEDYAVAAYLLGASQKRILFKHLLPSFISHIIVSLSLTVPTMILSETSLSFLGLGLRAPVVSWGVMLQDCMDVKAIIFYPWFLSPVILLVLAVLCFNFLGDGLRDAADPYSSK